MKKQDSKAHIAQMRQEFRSPIELKEVAETLWRRSQVTYSAAEAAHLEHMTAEEEAVLTEALELFHEAVSWAQWNDVAVQDYLAGKCGMSSVDYEDARVFCAALREALGEMAAHLLRGRELGLSALEQRVVDTLWSWVPHDYLENYVACAREVAAAIERLLPAESAKPTADGFMAYRNAVLAEVKRLAATHDVEFETEKYNLSLGYFCDWLAQEYGILSSDAWDVREFLQ